VAELQWDFFPYLPIVLQDASTKDVLMVQYMTRESLELSVEERSTWLWSRSRQRHWLEGRDGGGYDIEEIRANCMGDSLYALVDAQGKGVCHLGGRTCFTQPAS
jgi:phosphoribosyl-AMP cyclohydrolase / phosphoribosyl-ATP pyrophosphohydrolase